MDLGTAVEGDLSGTCQAIGRSRLHPSLGEAAGNCSTARHLDEVLADLDMLQANHVEQSCDVENVLRATGKDVELTIYPPFSKNEHQLFFEVRDLYWIPVIAFLDATIGSQ